MSETLPAKISTLSDLLKAPVYAQRFKEVLKDRAEQFISSVLSVGNTMPDVEPKSIIASAMNAAALDLPVNKSLGFAWIVPYKKGDQKLAQFQIGARGFIQLALRTGQYSRMNAKPINAEAFGGFDEVGEPVIYWDKVDELKPAVGYAFAWKLVNGFTKVCYWTKAKVEAHAQRYSQSYSKGHDSPWTTHFDKMSLKTVVKNELSQWGILSVQLERAFRTDQAVIQEDGEPEFIDASEIKPSKLVPEEPKKERKKKSFEIEEPADDLIK